MLDAMSKRIDGAYAFLSYWELDISLAIFLSLLKEILLKKDISRNIPKDLIRIYSWIWEIFQKKSHPEKSLQYYLKAYKISWEQDFNIVFNIWVLYKHLWQNEMSNEFIKKASILEKDNPLIADFILKSWETYSEKNKEINYGFEVSENWEKSIYIYLHSVCNFSCCFCDKSTAEYKKQISWKDTSFWEVKSIFESIDILEIKQISIWGNEPLSNKYIDEIMYYLDSLKIPLKLYTSGSEKQKFELLFGLKNLKQVFFPIYSTKKNIHDKIVWREGAFNDLKEMEGILLQHNIAVKYNRLIIKENIWDSDYINKDEGFSLLNPRDEKLYKKNAVQIKEIFAHIFWEKDKDFIVKMLINHSLPLCFMEEYFELLPEQEKDQLIHTIQEIFIIEKQKRINEKNDSYYTKWEKCYTCNLQKYCLGYYKYYFEIFWYDEVKAILYIPKDGMNKNLQNEDFLYTKKSKIQSYEQKVLQMIEQIKNWKK